MAGVQIRRGRIEAAKGNGNAAKTENSSPTNCGATVSGALTICGATISTAKMRLADEYDAAQERGEVATDGRPKTVADDNAKPATAADLGLRRDEIHEARQLRDAERESPGAIDAAIYDRVSAAQERGEVAGHGGGRNFKVATDNDEITAADLSLRRGGQIPHAPAKARFMVVNLSTRF